MRHTRFDIATIAVDAVDLPLRAAYLLVAETDHGDTPQWEVLVYAVSDEPLEQRIHRVDMVTLDHRRLRGDAALVRSVDGAHVLRGATALDGFDPDTDLAGG